MRLQRTLAMIAIPAALSAGCATAPRQPVFGVPTETLHICSGMTVSNAPNFDYGRRVEDFTPAFRLRNVVLARAPANACLASGYGARGVSAFHHGIDLYTGSPAAVLAGGDGVIAFKGRRSGYGNMLVIRHGNGVETRYAHLSDFAPGLREGRRVQFGEVIARTGNTGNATAVHLHYEVLVDGASVNPLTVGDGPQS